MSKELRNFIEDVKKDLCNKNYLAVDISHGYYIGDVLDVLLNESKAVKPLIITYGDEPHKMITEYKESNKTVQITVKKLLGDICLRDGDSFELIKGSEDNVKFNEYDTIIVYQANGLSGSILNHMRLASPYIPIFLLGDSKLACDDLDILRCLEKSNFYISETSKIPNYNLEVIYFNKRLRNGSISKFEETIHRSYEIQLKNFDNINLEELLQYSCVVTTKDNPRGLNSDIRTLFNYIDTDNILPKPMEPIISTLDILVPSDKYIFKKGFNETFNKGLYIPRHSILTIVNSVIENGVACVIVDYEYSDGVVIEFKVPINVSYYLDVLGLPADEDLKGIIRNTNGLCFEFAYVLSPDMVSFKAFDNVLIMFSSIDEASTGRACLYQLSAIARKKITVFVDNYYFLY